MAKSWVPAAEHGFAGVVGCVPFWSLGDENMNKGLTLGIASVLAAVAMTFWGPVNDLQAGHRCNGRSRCHGRCDGCWGGCNGGGCHGGGGCCGGSVMPGCYGANYHGDAYGGAA